jgi:hypothetical protein
MNFLPILAEFNDPRDRANFLVACKLVMEHAEHDWYDATLLDEIAIARRYLELVRPEAVEPFVRAFDAFLGVPGFHIRHFPGFLPQDEFAGLADAAARIPADDLDDSEVERHGRLRTNHHPLFVELQARYADWVGEQVGAKLEPSFNLFSRYSGSAGLPPHLDSPDSMWSLGVCIRADRPWPIHCSRTIHWPPREADRQRSAESKKRDPELEFREVSLEPNEAALFSGSCQWHYREPLEMAEGEIYEIVYFTYVPAGSRPLADVRYWPELFGLPELGPLSKALRLRRKGHFSSEPA